jgi:hypothetical protein
MWQTSSRLFGVNYHSQGWLGLPISINFSGVGQVADAEGFFQKVRVPFSPPENRTKFDNTKNYAWAW